MTEQRPPRVFISYSHDTVEHQERVLGLADRLRAEGIDAEIDQYNAAPPEGWPLWCERHIDAADFVLMVCTETYHRRVKGDEEQGKGLGVVWEARIIRQLLYDASAISAKFVPVLFSDASPEQIPTPIKGWTRYVVDTENGYEGLYRRLTGQPHLLRPALGTIRPLPPRRRQWPEGTMEAASSSPAPVSALAGKHRSMVQESSRDTTPSGSQPSLAIGVDVGTTKIAAGLIDIPEEGDPTVRHYKEIKHDDIGHETQLLERIEGAIRDVITDARIGEKTLNYVGVGLPGQVNYDAGCLTFAPGLKLRNISVASELRSKLDVPVFIDNDVNCATLAELNFGKAGKIYTDFVCIFVGTGIGAGIVINKWLFRGHGFSAGEIGHMKIDCGESARVCTCGNKGCFEEYASARAIIRLAREKIFEVRDRKEPSVLSNLSPEMVRPEDIVKAVKSKDESAIVLAERVGNYLAIGIANILNILNPQAVVLGGGIIEGLYSGCDSFKNAVSAGIKKSALDVCCNTPILTSTWGKKSPLIGAAVLGRCRI